MIFLRDWWYIILFVDAHGFTFKSQLNNVTKRDLYLGIESMHFLDGTGEHYVKWNKPDGVGQIPYDLTFNWNIINRRKKETNITRVIEVKNNLTMGRGE